jgi:hypothetical protein
MTSVMMPISFAQLTVGSSAVGLVSHLGYFINGEYHLQAPDIFRFFFIAVGILYITLLKIVGYGALESAKATVLMTGAYLGTAFTSLLVYRVFFHPLRSFPGPFLAKTSIIPRITPRTL